MKSIRLLFPATIILIFSLSANSQWRTDPENPGLVCDLAGQQSNVVSFSDAEGGAYVFWTDSRNNPGQSPREIYGQHYNNEGFELWEVDGRLVMSHYNGILNFKIARNNNGLMALGMITQSQSYPGGDTLRFQMLDESGLPVWANPLLVANAAADPTYILYISYLMILPVNDDFYVNIGVIYYGGANGNRFTRFDSNGNLTGSYDGVAIGNQSYVGATYLDETYDGSGDFYLFYATGNGAGASLHSYRFNGSGNPVWGPVDVTTGTTGLSYQLAGISDESGITFIWQGAVIGSTDLFSRRLTPGGAFAWGGNTVNICAAEGEQTNFHFKRKDMYSYVTWADARPGTSPGYFDIYAQKMDTTGYLYWMPNGLEITSFNTYVPYPLLEILDDNSIIVDHQSTVAGFMAQKVSSDGTLPWGPDAKQISTTGFNPFYQDHSLFQSGDNTIAVWNAAASGGGADGIYISRVDEVQYESLPEKGAGSIIVYPNPARSFVEIKVPEDMNVSAITLVTASGLTIESLNAADLAWNSSATICTDNLRPGIYILKFSNNSEMIVKKLVVW